MSNVINSNDYKNLFKYRDPVTGGIKSRLQATDPGSFIQYFYGTNLVGDNCTVSQISSCHRCTLP